MATARSRTRGSPERVTLDAIEQTHALIHLETEIRDVVRVGLFEMLHQGSGHALRQLAGDFLLPLWQHLFREERRELLLQLVGKLKIEAPQLPVEIAQDGYSLPRVVIAIVIEENDFASDFSLQPARGLDFCVEEAARENPARLLAEANDGRRHAVRRLVAPANTVPCRSVENRHTAAQPITLYHRYPMFVVLKRDEHERLRE